VADFRMPEKIARVLAKPLAVLTGTSRSLWTKRLRHPLCGWDEAVTREGYIHIFGREPDLKNPKTFNEKINWLKLFNRQPIHQIFADKVAVRDLVRERGFGEILNEIYGVWDRPEDVPVQDLPTSFALKAAHGWHMNWIRKPGEPLRIDEIRREMQRWIRTDQSLGFGEWQYRNVPRRILAEHFLGASGDKIMEYKVFCFGGVPKLMCCSHAELGTDVIHHMYFDLDWRELPIDRKGRHLFTDRPLRPVQFDEMVEVAAALSAGQPFLRVDLYEIGERVAFSELTLHPDGGAFPILPAEYDAKLGDMIELPARTG